VLFNK
jgi:hypothetical protein